MKRLELSRGNVMRVKSVENRTFLWPRKSDAFRRTFQDSVTAANGTAAGAGKRSRAKNNDNKKRPYRALF
jgi:hypothetical protein